LALSIKGVAAGRKRESETLHPPNLELSPRFREKKNRILPSSALESEKADNNCLKCFFKFLRVFFRPEAIFSLVIKKKDKRAVCILVKVGAGKVLGPVKNCSYELFKSLLKESVAEIFVSSGRLRTNRFLVCF